MWGGLGGFGTVLVAIHLTLSTSLDRGIKARWLLFFMSFNLSSQGLPAIMIDADRDSKVHGVNVRPTLVLLATDGPHDDPMNLALRGGCHTVLHSDVSISNAPPACYRDKLGMLKVLTLQLFVVRDSLPPGRNIQFSPEPLRNKDMKNYWPYEQRS